jgi:hypothetical protein
MGPFGRRLLLGCSVYNTDNARDSSGHGRSLITYKNHARLLGVLYLVFVMSLSSHAGLNLLLDALPTPECFATAFSSAAPTGTCANPVHEGSLALDEGSRAVRYLSTDRWGNLEEVRLQEFYVDGNPPVAELFAGASLMIYEVFILWPCRLWKRLL